MDILLFLLILLLPGYLLLSLFFNKLNAFLLLPLTFVFGLILLVLSALPTYFFSMNFSSSIVIILAYSLLLALISLRRRRFILKIEFPKDFISYTLLVLVIGAAVMMIWISPNIDGDALFHLGQIRKLAENTPVSPTEAFFPIDKINPAYGYNLWYFVIALIANISGTDVTVVWSHLVPILVPISVLSLYAFAIGLFKDQLPALTAAVIYVFILGYLGNAWEFRLAPYPDQIARHLILFVSLYLFLKFIHSKNTEKRIYFFFTVLSAALLTMVHLFSWVHFLLALGAFGIISLRLLPFRYFRNSLMVILATLVLSAPYLFFKLQNSSSVLGTVDLKKDALVLFDKFFIINPWSSGPLFLISLFALIYLVFIYRKNLKNHIWLVFTLSSAFIGILILYNPIGAPVTAKLISYTYMHRLGNLLYKEVILAAFLFFIVFSVIGKVKIDKGLRTILILVITFIIIITPIEFNGRKTEDRYLKSTNDLTTYIQENLPKNSVFAADLWTSYNIPAYTNNYIVATYPSHMTANVHKPSRLEDLKIIFSPETTLKESKEILIKYDVSFVVVNDDLKSYDILVDTTKFEKVQGFKEIYSSGNYRIYSYFTD